MNKKGKLSMLTGGLEGAQVAFILPETQVCFFLLPWVAVGHGKRAYWEAVWEQALVIGRAISGFFRDFPKMAASMKGQSQRWSIDVNKTNSR